VNPFEFVLIIICLAFGAGIIMRKMELSHGRRGILDRGGNDPNSDPKAADENQRLRAEVSELKERIHVLERIATDKENSLAREIENLRDR
jgi:hypothetical protein